MVTLKNDLTKRYYFIKDTIIFNIKNSNPNNDSCAFIPEDCEHLIVTKDDESKKYYLDVLLEDGDYFTGEYFIKREHAKKSQDERNISLTEWYKIICEEQIKNKIKSNPNYTFEYFNKNKSLLNIPIWMFENQGYEVVQQMNDESYEFNNIQIDFTEEYFNQKKEEAVKELIYSKGESIANSYGFKLTDNTVIDIEPKE